MKKKFHKQVYVHLKFRIIRIPTSLGFLNIPYFYFRTRTVLLSPFCSVLLLFHSHIANQSSSINVIQNNKNK